MNPLVTTGQDRRRDVTALSVNVNKIALLRAQLHYHLGTSQLRTRQVMIEAQALGH